MEHIHGGDFICLLLPSHPQKIHAWRTFKNTMVSDMVAWWGKGLARRGLSEISLPLAWIFISFFVKQWEDIYQFPLPSTFPPLNLKLFLKVLKPSEMVLGSVQKRRERGEFGSIPHHHQKGGAGRSWELESGRFDPFKKELNPAQCLLHPFFEDGKLNFLVLVNNNIFSHLLFFIVFLDFIHCQY